MVFVRTQRQPGPGRMPPSRRDKVAWRRWLVPGLCGLAALVLSACGDVSSTGTGDPRPPTLFLAGDGEFWVVDADAETSEHIRMPELSPGDPPYRVVARGDRVVLWGYDTYTLDPRYPDRPPDVLARDSWIFIPSDEADRVWIGVVDPKGHTTVRGLEGVREVTADGEVTVADVPPPHGGWPQASLTHGLLFFAPDEGLILWDPETEKVLRHFDYSEIQDMGPTHGDLLASCPGACQELWVTDMLSGDRTTIPAPDGIQFDIWSGEFSPDGETLAVPIVATGADSGESPYKYSGESPRKLALVSLKTGEVTTVPGSGVPGGYAFATWTSSGEDVFLTGGQRFHGRRVVVYHEGDDSARLLDVEVGDFYDAAGW